MPTMSLTGTMQLWRTILLESGVHLHTFAPRMTVASTSMTSLATTALCTWPQGPRGQAWRWTVKAAALQKRPSLFPERTPTQNTTIPVFLVAADLTGTLADLSSMPYKWYPRWKRGRYRDLKQLITTHTHTHPYSDGLGTKADSVY